MTSFAIKAKQNPEKICSVIFKKSLSLKIKEKDARKTTTTKS